MSLWESYKKVSFFKKIFIALLMGLLAGILFREKILFIKPLGQIFLNLLRMVALPLIIVNLIAGISSLNDPKILGRVGFKIFVYYTFTTICALIVGIFTAFLLKPGLGFVFKETYDKAIEKVPSLGETVVNLIPNNIFSALSTGRFDQIILFSLFLGIAILFLPKPQKDYLAGHFEMLAALFRKLVWIAMGFAPIGVFALMATTVGAYGTALAGFVAKYLTATYTSILIMLVIYTILLMLLARVSPLEFYKGAAPVFITTITTSSSLATVPISLAAADDLGVPRSISGFTIPLGSQMNKDGNGIMLALSFVAVAQAVGVPLPLPVLVKAIFLGLILTTGAGGVPGGGIVTIAIIVDSFGLPLEMVAIIAGIFGLIDMGLTMLNCVGDLVGTLIVSRSEEKRLRA